MVNIGLIGLGYWGNNYLKALAYNNIAKLKAICDEDVSRLSALNIDCYKTTNSYEIAKDNDIDAVIIATPASTHYKLAKMMLEHKKHVLVEKPLTMNYKHAKELCKIAEEHNRILMVGHIYCYNTVVNYIKNLLINNKLGELYYGIGQRLGLGPIRDDADCIWDLAVHDIAMLDYLVEDIPISINAAASSFIRKGIYDQATISLQYKNGFNFTLIVSWYAAEKIRLWYLMGSESMLRFDDVKKDIPLTIFNKKVIVQLLPITKNGVGNE